MDANEVRKLVAKVRKLSDDAGNQFIHGDRDTGVELMCRVCEESDTLADACEALLAERDKLVERNWYLEHDKQHDVLRLQERVAELEAALEPFADNSYAHNTPDNHVAFGGPMVTVGDYRRAVALLAKKQSPGANTLPTPIPGEPPETP